jgi:hypothetical protein
MSSNKEPHPLPVAELGIAICHRERLALVLWSSWNGWIVRFATDHEGCAEVAEVYTSAKHRLPTLMVWHSAIAGEFVCDDLAAGELTRGDLGLVLERAALAVASGAVMPLEPTG